MTKQSIDISFLKEIVGDDLKFEKELLTMFLENGERNIIRMEEAIANKDRNAWYMASHAFKGASASIGAFELSKILEHAQKSPDAVEEEKRKIVQQVKGEFKMVGESVKKEMTEISTSLDKNNE